jgi:beta-lactamase regulating signal transducer with metallopeptidase domain
MDEDSGTAVAFAWVLTYALHSTVLIGAVWLFLRLRPKTSHAFRDGLWKLGLVGGIVTAGIQVGFGLQPVGGSWVLAAPATAPAPVADGSAPTDEADDISVPVLPPAASLRGPEPRVAPAGPGTKAATSASPTTRPSPPFPARHVRATPPPEPADPRSRELARASFAGDRERGPASGTAMRVEVVEVVEVVEATGPSPSDEPGAALVGDVGGRGAPPGLERAALAASLSTPLVAAWIVGAAFGVAVLLFALGRLRRHLLGRRALDSGPVAELFADLVARAGVRRKVRLSVSRDLATPITFGLLRSEICIPERALVGLAPDQQEAMLAHELAHAVRRDPAWQIASRLLVAGFFFQPLNRLARRHLLDTAEYLSDDWAVAHTANELSLASCLTEIAGWVVGDRRARPESGMAPGMASGSRLGRRVHRLLEPHARGAVRRGRRLGKVVALGGLAVITGVVPGVAAAVAEGRPDAPEERRLSHALEPDAPREERDEPGLSPDASAVQVTLRLLDAQIAELEAEVEELRAAVLVLPDGHALLESVQNIELRITRLVVRRTELADKLPLLVGLLEARTSAPDPDERPESDRRSRR